MSEKKKSYSVLVPATMSISILVEGEDEEQAKSKAFDVSFTVKVSADSEDDSVELIEFETHESVCRGNVFSGVLNEVEVDCMDGEDD